MDDAWFKFDWILLWLVGKQRVPDRERVGAKKKKKAKAMKAKVKSDKS